MTKRILVLGDAMLDEWVSGNMASCQDGCVKFDHRDRIRTPGGAANAARSLIRSGAEVYLCAITGGLSLAADSGCFWHRDYEFIEGSIPIKRRYLCDRKIVFRVDEEKLGYGLKDTDLVTLRTLALKAVQTGSWDGVLISDYAKGFLTDDLIRGIIAFCNQQRVPVVADLKRSPSVGTGAILKCNQDYADKWGVHVLDHSPASVVTLGSRPPHISDQAGVSLQKAQEWRTVECRSHVGAGDCFASWFVLALANGHSLPEACREAHAAGRVHVQHLFGRPPWPHEIALDLDPVGGKVVRREGDLSGIRASHPGRIVFAPGVFRLLNAGHCWLLDWAKKQGDILVVGINDDLSAYRQKLKGYVLPLEERMRMLAGLECVDFVVPFPEDWPVNILWKLKPNLMVKGSEFRGKDVPGSDLTELLIAPEGPFPRHATDMVNEIRSA